MLRLEPYVGAMQDEWDRVARDCGTVFHTTAFRRILLDSFGYREASHAAVDGQGRIVALLPLVAGRNLRLQRTGVSLPFVNVLDVCAADANSSRDLLESVPSLRKGLGLSAVELRLRSVPDNGAGWRVFRGNFTFSLPLLDDEPATLSQASASCRNHVRKAYKNGWFDVTFDPDRLPEFYRVYATRMKQLGSPSPALGFFRSYFRHLPGQTSLLSVLDRQTGRVAGGMLLLTDPGRGVVHYLYGANLVEYNARYLNSFMYWEAVRFGLRQRMKVLDLGRSPAGSGTFHYKSQWGALPEQLHYAFCAGEAGEAGPPDRGKLNFWIEMWKRAPACITGPVGTRLIRHVMP